MTKTSLLLAALLLSAPPAYAEMRLVPRPRQVTPDAGVFPLRGAITIAVASADSDDWFAAGLLQQEIESASPARARVVRGEAGQVVLARDPALAGAGDEGYRIEARSSGVRVNARTAAGIFYGVQTLRQMVGESGIPVAVIEDRPAMRWRGVQIDVSRGPVATLQSLERCVRTLAEFKVNLCVLYLENVVAYRSQPLLGSGTGSLRPDEIRQLVAESRRYHVEIVPQQQTSAHMHSVLRYESYKDIAEVPYGGMLTPSSPKSYEFVKGLYDEIAQLFPGPFLHVGADEMSELGQGKSRALVERVGAERAYFDHLTKMHELLAPHGRRLMFWGDFVLAHPALLRELPHDMLVATYAYDTLARYDSRIRPFRDAQLDVFVCPGVIGWNRVFPNLDIAIPSIRDLTRDGQRLGAIGQLNCTWADNGDALFALNWYPLLFGAAAAWQEGACDPVRFAADFDWALFRNPGAEVAGAIARINSAHSLVRGQRPTDANLALAWMNPLYSRLDRQLLAELGPIAAPIRLAMEEAIEGIERARPGARSNTDLLDAYVFAARRLHFLSFKIRFANQIPGLYKQAFENQLPGGRPAIAVTALAMLRSLCNEGEETIQSLRADHERLWSAENRPYWLGNILAQYDRDAQIWLNDVDACREWDLMVRVRRPLPTAEQLGFDP